MTIKTSTFAKGQRVQIDLRPDQDYHTTEQGKFGTYVADSSYGFDNFGYVVIDGETERKDFYHLDLKPVAFKAGDRVRRNAKDHMLGGSNFQHREAPEGELGTVTGYGWNGDALGVKWDHGRSSVIEAAGLDPHVDVITVQDITKAIGAVEEAERVLNSRKSVLATAERNLEDAKAAVEAARTKRDDIISNYKG